MHRQLTKPLFAPEANFPSEKTGQPCDTIPAGTVLATQPGEVHTRCIAKRDGTPSVGLPFNVRTDVLAEISTEVLAEISTEVQ